MTLTIMSMFTLPLAAFGLPMGSELILIVILALVLFGGKKIPELMRGMGQGVGELKKGLEEGKQGLSDLHNKPAESVEVNDEKKEAK
jgi:sec-independent protein translocase protein TatA